MRLSTVLFHCGTLLQCAAAKDAYLYTFNSAAQSPSNTPATISAETAFLIVSRRQGATHGLKLGQADEEALSQISQHGGYQQPLFGDGVDTEPQRVLVTIQAEKPEVIPSLKKDHALEIHAPTQDLLDLGSRGIGGACHTFAAVSKEGVKMHLRMNGIMQGNEETKGPDLKNGDAIVDLLRRAHTFLDTSTDMARISIDIDFTSSKLSPSKMSTHIDSVLKYLQTSTSNLQPTVLVLPPTIYLAKSSTKRTTPEEELLDLLPANNDDDNEITPLDTLVVQANYKLPARFPSCFNSKSACTNSTNSCSGHGTCRASGSNKNCYQCFCSRTVVRTNDDGSKKTTQWAGAACQKKDISVEFTLFATFGVTMAALLMGVIGMMYSMGGQELPSVIGAGVAGPTARK